MKKRSVYDSMTASDLGRVTRDRGLEKPAVTSLSEWAGWLEADDTKRRTESRIAPQFETVDAIGSISVPEDTAANLVILVSALGQRAGLDVDTTEDDESLDLISRLTNRLAQALPDVELMPTDQPSGTDQPNDGDRDEEDAEADASHASHEAPSPTSTRPKSAKSKGS